MIVKFKKMTKATVLFALLLSTTAFNASANTKVDPSNYNSNDYLKTQYEIVENIFDDLDVSLVNGRNIKIVLPVEYAFKKGRLDLTRTAIDDLTVYSKFLQKYPESTVEIRGHADSTGSESINLNLSQKRADVFYYELLKNGVSSYRLKSIGEGEEVPRCSNKTKKGRECNKRVELILSLEPFLY